MQAALRRTLCAAPAPPGQDSGPVAANGGTSGGGIATPTTPLSAGLGARKAPACLLAGYLVESGVPGWEDTKAAMIPPPHQLLEAADGPVGGDPLRGQPLSALRLEVLLRSLLCDADSSLFDTGVDVEKSFPDVFRTARALARAIARHASSLVTSATPGPGAPPPGGYHPAAYSGGGAGGVALVRPYSVSGAGRGGGGGGGSRTQETGAVERLEWPGGSLAGRLQSAPAAGALVSWVSSVVKTAKQYGRWLPRQAIADELRELVLLSVRQQPVHSAEGGGGDAAGGRALAAEAAVFAVCELLLAWRESDEVKMDGVTGIKFCLVVLFLEASHFFSLRPPSAAGAS